MIEAGQVFCDQCWISWQSLLGRATHGLAQVPVLPPQPYADIWVVGHPDVWPGAKVAAFRELLVPHFRARRADFVA